MLPKTFAELVKTWGVTVATTVLTMLVGQIALVASDINHSVQQNREAVTQLGTRIDTVKQYVEYSIYQGQLRDKAIEDRLGRLEEDVRRK